MPANTMNPLLGDLREVAVERALAEIRSGRPVLLEGAGTHLLTAAAESADDALLAAMTAAGEGTQLVLSSHRARLLGYGGPGAAALVLAGLRVQDIHEIVSQTGVSLDGHRLETAGAGHNDVLELVRLSYLLPAAITVPLSQADADCASCSGVARVDGGAIRHYRENVLASLRIVARAPVPLEDAGETEFVVFRGGEGMRDQIAVVIGKPSPSEPVYARLHSACLTGDLFGSLKCDCGDQLRGTVRHMAELGGGILLYLDQEGRGNGIANKIRAYHLQHCGYDTFDADEILGFGLDQRRFDFAAAMLRQLGHTAIRLLTNNPAKVLALQEAGLDVVSSHPVKARLTLQNAGYLAAKRDRAGHNIDDDLKC